MRTGKLLFCEEKHQPRSCHWRFFPSHLGTCLCFVLRTFTRSHLRLQPAPLKNCFTGSESTKGKPSPNPGKWDFKMEDRQHSSERISLTPTRWIHASAVLFRPPVWPHWHLQGGRPHSSKGAAWKPWAVWCKAAWTHTTAVLMSWVTLDKTPGCLQHCATGNHKFSTSFQEKSKE